MCKRVDELMREWERTGSLSPRDLAVVAAHVQQCPRCARLHGGLMPLLHRDAGGSSSPARLDSEPLPKDFAERFMRRLSSVTHAGRAARRGPRVWAFRAPLPLALAAGAAVLVAAGLLVWFGGLRPGRDEVLVRFELVAPEARSVSLVGDFNGWDPRRLPMKDATGQGLWQASVRLKRGSVYTYNFLMDSQRWVADPTSLRQVDDGFGGTSSLLEL
ncbi:MAG: hypothetical protein JW820_08820 [Spirochaetales bacterium]|nr:hypothetical protein [Spirochaetales bacterium]